MVTRTGFEPVYACVKGMCVKPLHQRALYFPFCDFVILSSQLVFVKSFLEKSFFFFSRSYSIIFSTNISFVKYFLKFFVSSFYLPETNFYIIPGLSFLVKSFFEKSFSIHYLLLKRTSIYYQVCRFLSNLFSNFLKNFKVASNDATFSLVLSP